MLQLIGGPMDGLVLPWADIGPALEVDGPAAGVRYRYELDRDGRWRYAGHVMDTHEEPGTDPKHG